MVYIFNWITLQWIHSNWLLTTWMKNHVILAVNLHQYSKEYSWILELASCVVLGETLRSWIFWHCLIILTSEIHINFIIHWTMLKNLTSCSITEDFDFEYYVWSTWVWQNIKRFSLDTLQYVTNKYSNYLNISLLNSNHTKWY